jgi:flagellar biosynthesis GTPase FlhF
MVSFLALLPRSLTTFLYAVAALLRFYGNTDTIPIPRIPLTILGWSLLAFALGTASLLVNLSLEWNAGNRSRAQAEDARLRAENERIRSRQREARQDNLADEERNKADRERERAEEERTRAENERIRSRQREARQDDLADQERERSAARARIQNRWIILEIRHQLTPSPETRAALTDLVSFLQEYGE